MKRICFWAAIFLPFVLSSISQDIVATLSPSAPVETVKDRKSNFRVHQRISEAIVNGKAVRSTNEWTLVQPGVAYYSETDGAWKDTSVNIELADSGAIYRQGPFQIKFPADYTQDAIEFTLPDKGVVKLQTIGLALTDGASGDSVWLGEARPTGGFLDRNTITYSDAFEGVKADIIAKVEIGKWENDIVLREQVLTPETLGWNPENARLEIWHRIVQMPAAAAQPRMIRRANGSEDIDEQLAIGEIMLGPGAAFLAGTNQAPISSGEKSIDVSKERFIDTENNATYLIEKIPYTEALPHIRTLPARAQANVGLKDKLKNAKSLAAKGKRQKPISLAKLSDPTAKPEAPRKVAMMSGAASIKPGFVMDYDWLYTATNFVFQGSKTYYLTNDITLSGTTILEGGAVVKFGSSNGVSRVNVTGQLDCQTSAYAPAIFTADADNSVGSQIKTNALSGYYGQYNLYIGSSNTNKIHDIRTKYANCGLFLGGTNDHTLFNVQIISCSHGIEASDATVYVRNLLSYGGIDAFYGSNVTYRAEHVTAHLGDRVFVGAGTASLYLTNSLVVAMTNSSSGVTLDHSSAVASDSGVFETKWAGAHYLPSGTDFALQGTPNISEEMKAILNTHTTAAPLELTNAISKNTIIGPRVPRGSTNAPTLGYHYSPVDYVASALAITNATLTLTNGAAVAAAGYALFHLQGTGAVASQGRADRLNILATFETVQEQSNKYLSNGFVFFSGFNAAIRFTEMSTAGSESYDRMVTTAGGVDGTFTVNDSYLRNVGWYLAYDKEDNVFEPTVTLKNNILQGCAFEFDQTCDSPYRISLSLRNNLVKRTQLSVVHCGSSIGAMEIYDNLFDDASLFFAEEDPFPYTYGGPLTSVGFNGYTSTNAVFGGTSNKTGLVVDYQSGPLGEFYYPSTGASNSLASLINVGSLTNAALAGLFHYTTVSNSSEWNTQLDIGFHYAGLLDSDGDGVLDAVEDVNGNGLVDAGETSFADADSNNDGFFDSFERNARQYDLYFTWSLQATLDTWAFRDGTFISSARQRTPYATNGVVLTNLLSGSSAIFNATPAKLQYLEVDPAGDSTHFTILRARGTVDLWFNPFWNTSTTTNVFASTNFGQLICLGAASSGNTNWWSLHFSPKGDALIFETQADGTARTNVTASINWTNSTWYRVTLTYDTNAVALYTNGIVAATNSLGPLFPNYWTRQNGKLCIGSREDGYGIVSGIMDDIETWNYPLSAAQIFFHEANLDNNDADGDGVPTAVELRLGTNPLLADSDGDGLPDGWEIHYGLNPTNSMDADTHLSGHTTSPWQDFLYGLDPTLTNTPPAATLVNQATAATNLFNLDFGPGSTSTNLGYAAAGFSTNDVWGRVSPASSSVTDAGGGSQGVSINMVYFFGHLAYNELHCPELVTPSNQTDPVSSAFNLMTNIVYGVTCTTNEPSDDILHALESPPGTNCVHWTATNVFSDHVVFMTNYYVNSPQSWANDVGYTGTFPTPSGVGTNVMFGDYAYSGFDLVTDQMLRMLGCNQPYFARDGHSAMYIGNLPGSWYRVYIYAAAPGLSRATRLWVNGKTVAPPTGGCSEDAFVKNVNYATVTVPLDHNAINFIFLTNATLLNGIQLMRLQPLAAPSTPLLTFSEERGVTIRWSPVPTSIAYEIARTNVATGEFTVLRSSDASSTAGASGSASIFSDPSPPRTNELKYLVRAISDVPAYASEWTTSASITPPPLTTNFFHHSPELQGGKRNRQVTPGKITLDGAFENTPFPILLTDLLSASSVSDQDGNRLWFVVTAVNSGKLQQRATNGTLIQITSTYLATNRAVQINIGKPIIWTPPIDTFGDGIDAFEVAVTDGEFISDSRAIVSINVKPSTTLMWWGFFGDGNAGNGIPRSQAWYDHDYYLRQKTRPAKVWSEDPSPVIVASDFVPEGVKPNLTNVVQMAGQGSLHAALTADGSVWTWGSTGFYLGLGGIGDGIVYHPPGATNDPPWFNWEAGSAIMVTNLTDVRSIALGLNHCVAVKSDGTVWGWGDNGQGQLGEAATPLYAAFPYNNRNADPNDDLDWFTPGVSAPVQIPGLNDAVAVAASTYSTIVLTSQGQVYFFGEWDVDYFNVNDSGTLEIKERSQTPVLKTIPTAVTQIAAGGDHFLALTIDGDVYAWGNNKYGSLGVSTPGTDNSTIPLKVSNLANVIWIAASGNASLAVLADGSVAQWGSLSTGPTLTPTRVGGLKNIVRAYLSSGNGFAVDDANRLFGWGYNTWGALGVPFMFGNNGFINEYHEDAVLVSSLESVAAFYPGNTTMFATVPNNSFRVRGLQAVSKDQSIELSWRSYPGASGYEVQKSTHQNTDSAFALLTTLSASSAATTLTYIDSSVVNGGSYYYRVRAIVPGGYSDFSVIVEGQPSPPPGGISDFSAEAINGGVQLKWLRVAHSMGYEVQRKLNGGWFSPLWRVSDGGVITGNPSNDLVDYIVVQDYDLTPADSAYYMVRATNFAGAGPWSTNAGPATCLTNLPAPRSLVVETNGNAHWLPPDIDGWDGYYIVTTAPKFKSGSRTPAVTSQIEYGTNVTITADQPGQTYIISVQGVSGLERTLVAQTDWLYLDEASLRPGIQMLATNWGTNFIYARWTGTARDYLVLLTPTTSQECTVGFTVYPDEQGTTEFFATDVPTTTTNLQIFQVWNDLSAPSNSFSQAVSISGSSPTNFPPLTLLAASNRVVATWFGSISQSATNMDLYGDWRFILQRKFDPHTDLYCPFFETVFDSNDLKPGMNRMGVEDTNVVNGTAYTYRLYGINSSNEVRPWGTVSVTPAITYPTNTTFTLTSSNRNGGVHLEWTSLTNATAGYILTRVEATNAFSPWSTLFLSAGVSSYDDYPLDNGKSYFYVVTATNLNYDFLPSNSVMAMPSESAPLVKPAGFSAHLSGLTLIVDWIESPGAQAYGIYHSGSLVQSVLRPEFAVAYATNNSQYRYTVEAQRRGATASQAITAETIAWTNVPSATKYVVSIVESGVTNAVGETTSTTYENVRLGDFASIGTYVITPYNDTIALTAISATARGATGIVSPTLSSVTLLDLSAATNNAPQILTPTNYLLRISTTVPLTSIASVRYFSDGTFLGSTTNAPYQFEWVNPPGGIGGLVHAIKAQVVNSAGAIYESDAGYLNVLVQPDLSAFTTSVTDLSVPAPGLPLELTRYYDSRDSASGLLGRGWKLPWERATIFMTDPSPDWAKTTIGVVTAYREARFHPIYVDINGGREIFAPAANTNSTIELASAGQGNGEVEGETFSLVFMPVQGNGRLFNPRSPTPGSDLVFVSLEDGTKDVYPLLSPKSAASYAPRNLKYESMDGSQFWFSCSDAPDRDRNFTLTSMGDRFGNSITNNRATNNVIWLQHSNGRALMLTNSGSGWLGYDPVELAHGVSALPVLKYILNASNLLGEVHQARDRSGTNYDITYYGYDSSNRLASITGPDGVVRLANQYDTNCFVTKQTDAIGLESSLAFSTTNGAAHLEVSQNLSGGVTNVVSFGSGGQLSSVQPDAQDGANVASVGYRPNGLPAYQAQVDGSYTSYSYDGASRLTAAVDALGNTVRTDYNDPTVAGPTTVTDARNVRTQYSYYGLSAIQTTNVNDVANPAGTLATATDGAGMITANTYNFHGQILSETRTPSEGGLSLVTKYQYENNGDLARTLQLVFGTGTNAVYVTNSFSYDANGNRLSDVRWRHVINRTNGIAGDTPTLTTEAITNLFSYDSRNRLLATTNAVGEVSGTLYDANGKASKSTNTLGQVTSYLYDVRGNLLETTYADSTVSRTVFDERGRPAWTQERATADTNSVTVAPATETQYDSLGRVNLVYRHENTAIQKVTLSSTDPTNSITPGTYYRKLAGMTGVTQYTMSVVTNGATASITRTDYDSMGRAQYTVNAFGGVTANGYDTLGRRTSVTNYTTYTLSNIATNAISPGTNAFVLTQFGYDENGNQIWTVDGNGHRTDFYYDNLNRKTVTQFPIGAGESARQIQQTVFDGLGRRVFEIDEVSVTNAFQYDLLGRLIAVTNDYKTAYATSDQPAITMYAYDELGNMTNQVRDIYTVDSYHAIASAGGQQRVTWFEYDKLGRRTYRFLPTSGPMNIDTTNNAAMEQTTYTNVGSSPYTLRKMVKDFRGITITNDYDSMDRLITKKLPAVNSGEVLRTVSYDYSGPLLTMMRENGTGIARTNYYHYDDSRRLQRKDTPEGVLTYTYAANSAVTTIKGYARSVILPVDTNVTTQTTSSSIGYAYDVLGRLSAVTNVSISSGVTTYTYDGAGNLALTAYPQNRITNTFDPRNRLTNIRIGKNDGTLLRQFDYAYSTTSLRTNVTEWVLSGTNTVQRRKVAYRYDQGVPDIDLTQKTPAKLNRLSYEDMTEASSGDPTGGESFLYDELGNRRILNASSVSNVSGYNIEYNILDQFDTGYSYAFDANGNTTNSPGSIVDYFDTENRFVKRVNGTTTITMGYDADGNRVWRHVNANGTHATIFFLIDDKNPTGYPQIATQFKDTASSPAPVTATFNGLYEWGHKLISFKQSGTNYWAAEDGLGSVRSVMLTTGATLSGHDYDYDAHGALINSPGSTIDLPIRYANYEWDTPLGMYHNGPRYLDVKTGRFWQRDSVEGNPSDPASLHLYTYCRADPVNRIDPSGHFDLVEILNVAAIQLYLRAPQIAAVAGYTALVSANVYIWSSVAIAADDAFFEGGNSESLYTLRDASGKVFFISALAFESANAITITPTTTRNTSANDPEWRLNKNVYPEAAEHIQEAQAAGYAAEVTISRSSAAANRAASLKGVPRIKGLDRDEYPPAATLEGGGSASVRHIDPSDNRGAGASFGKFIRQFPDGTKIRITVTDEKEK